MILLFLEWVLLSNINTNKLANNYFQFKQFIIHHDRCAMKVGTDAVLLGAWVNLSKVNTILEIGSGSGIISIMLAQRCSAIIGGIEIDQESHLQSVENATLTPWCGRISFIHNSFQNYCIRKSASFDLIISNPPFFVNSLKATDNRRSAARHASTLSFNEIIEGVFYLLNPLGRLAIILPYSEGCIFIAEAVKMGLYCIRKTNVKSVPHAPVIRLLLEFSLLPAPCHEDFLVIGTGENEMYTEKYKAITKDFYLKF